MTDSGEDKKPFSESGGWLLVMLLTCAAILSYVDRQVLSLLVEPIRGSLGLTDGQFGAIQGISFSIFFLLASLPIARLADRSSRPRIIAAATATWSAMTIFCGLAGNFWQLMLARIGVAAGEGGLAPAALTLMADSFSRKRLARVTAVYMLAPFIGGGLALVGGGLLYAMAGDWVAGGVPLFRGMEQWRIVFLVVSLPGFLVAMLVLALLREPRKIPKDRPRTSDRTALVGFFRGEWRFATAYTLSTGFVVLIFNAQIAWMPATLMRTHGLSPQEVGPVFGAAYLACGIVGSLITGYVVGRSGEDMVGRTLQIMRLAALVMMPCVILAPLVANFGVQVALAAASVFCTSAVLSMASIPFQFTAPFAARAQAIALQGMIASLIGTGLGPLLVGLVSDSLGQSPRALAVALATVSGLTAPIVVALLTVVLKAHRIRRLDLIALEERK